MLFERAVTDQLEILDRTTDGIGGDSAKDKGGLIMAAKRTIDATEIAKDIRSHMTDDQLMAKYSLSARRGLERVMRKLLEVKLITQFEFDCRPVEYDDTGSWMLSYPTGRSEVFQILSQIQY